MDAINAAVELSGATRRTAGIILLTVVAIEFGGWYLLRTARAKTARTSLQNAFERAGHAHAGVLVTLALVCLVLADLGHVQGTQAAVIRAAMPGAAILVPAGFFFSVTGRNVSSPNGFVVLIYLGMVSLAVGVIGLGLALLAT